MTKPKLPSAGILSRKRSRESSDSSPQSLAFRPIYPTIEVARSNRGSVENPPAGRLEGNWTKLSLPASLGRVNLVQAWWASCPDDNCQALQREQGGSNIKQDWVCCYCSPMKDAEKVLSLSKEMLLVSLDGTVTVVAKHKEIVHFVSENSQEKHILQRKSPSGMLSIGKRLPSNRIFCLIDGPWMQFELRLSWSREERVYPQSAEEPKSPPPPTPTAKEDHYTDKGIWHLSTHPSASMAKRRESRLFNSTQRRKRRLLLAADSDSGDEDEGFLQEAGPQSPLQERNFDNHKKPDKISPARRKLDFAETGNGSNRSGAGTCAPRLYHGSSHALQNPENKKLSGSQKRGNSQNLNVATGLHPWTPRASQKRARLVTPEEEGREEVIVKDTQRRLEALDQNESPQEEICQKKTNLRSSLSQTKNNLSATKNCILSMPDDRSESEDESSEATALLVLKEVSTQKMPTLTPLAPPRKAATLTLEEWKLVSSVSTVGSFRNSLAALVVSRNKHDPKSDGSCWLPSLIQPNTLIDFGNPVTNQSD